MAHVLEAQYNWPVPAGTTLDRTSAGWDSWIIAQYLNDSIQLFLEGKFLETTPGCFLIVRPNTRHSYTCHATLRHNWAHLDGDVDAYPICFERSRSPITIAGASGRNIWI